LKINTLGEIFFVSGMPQEKQQIDSGHQLRGFWDKAWMLGQCGKITP